MKKQIRSHCLASFIASTAFLLLAQFEAGAASVSQLAVGDPSATNLNWDTSSLNWRSGATPVAFKNGDAVTLNSNGSSPMAIQVMAPGITTSQISLGSGDYVFSGSALTIDNAGYDTTGLSRPGSLFVLTNYSGTTTFNNAVHSAAGLSLQGYSNATINFNGGYTGGNITAYYDIAGSPNELKLNGNGISISNVTGYVNGSAILLMQGSIGNVTNSTFRGNSSINTGGAIHVNKGTLTLSNSRFENNSCVGTDYANGGALYSNLSTVSLSNLHVENNTATAGAGYFSNATNATIADSTFIGNVSSNYGTVYNVAASTMTITGNTLFQNNRATSGAGAIFNRSGSTLNVGGATFDGNSTNGGGGAIENYEASSQIFINDSVFTNNVAQTNGGALNTQKSSQSTINNSTFRGNQAAQGGASFNQSGGIASFDNTIFDSNRAIIGAAGTGNGGAIGLVGADSAVAVSNSNFTGNTAANQGGALYAGESATLTNVNMTGNTAGNQGGAIYVNTGLTNSSKTLTLAAEAGKTTTISGNTATNGGNGIAFGRMSSSGKTTNALSNASLILSGAGTINLHDSISADLNNGKSFTLSKTGTGTLNWGSASTVDAAGQSTIELTAGQTNLLSGFSLQKGAVNDTADFDHFVVNNSATLNLAASAQIAGFNLTLQDTALLNVASHQLTVDNLSAAEGTSLRFEITNGSYGHITLTHGDFYINSGTILELDSSNLTFGADRYDFVTGITSAVAPDSTLTYNGTTIGNGDIVTLGGRDYNFQLGNTLSLVAVTAAVPEPATYALLAASCVLLAVFLARRKNRK